jgi:hypothetical protein
MLALAEAEDDPTRKLQILTELRDCVTLPAEQRKRTLEQLSALSDAAAAAAEMANAPEEEPTADPEHSEEPPGSEDSSQDLNGAQDLNELPVEEPAPPSPHQSAR